MFIVALDCNDKNANIIKRKLNVYFEDIKYVGNNQKEISLLFKEMNTLNDIQLIDKKRENIDYIFLIHNSDYMFDMLEYNPLMFIRINQVEEDLERLIHILQYKRKGIGVNLEFKSGYQTVRINAENIVYIESYNHYLLIHTQSATFKVREKLAQALLKLKPLGFVQVHKSYIINKSFIKKKNSSKIIMDTEDCIPIGQKYRKSLNNEF